MKFNFTYGTSCVLTVIDTISGHWDYSPTFNNVQEAFNFADDIFNGHTAWDAKNIDVIYITDKNTGEILVECYHDEHPTVKYDNEGDTICPHEWDDVDCKDCEIQKFCNR